MARSALGGHSHPGASHSCTRAVVASSHRLGNRARQPGRGSTQGRCRGRGPVGTPATTEQPADRRWPPNRGTVFRAHLGDDLSAGSRHGHARQLQRRRSTVLGVAAGVGRPPAAPRPAQSVQRQHLSSRAPYAGTVRRDARAGADGRAAPLARCPAARHLQPGVPGVVCAVRRGDVPARALADRPVGRGARRRLHLRVPAVSLHALPSPRAAGGAVDAVVLVGAAPHRAVPDACETGC